MQRNRSSQDREGPPGWDRFEVWYIRDLREEVSMRSIRCSIPRRLPAFLVLAALFLLPGAGRAESIEVILRYPRSQFVLEQRDGYTEIRLSGGELLSRVGAPRLPCRAEQVVLPAGREVRQVRAVSRASIRIPAGTIRPVQPPAILGLAGLKARPLEVAAPDPEIFGGTSPYPPELVVYRGTGNLGGRRVAAVEVHPVQLDPATGELVLHTEIAVELVLEDRSGAGVDPSREARARLRARPREIDRVDREFAAGLGLSQDTAGIPPPGSATSDPSARPYLIITEEAQRPAYERYAAWKTAKGLPAEVATVESIAQNEAGRDLPEKIRNFIIDAAENRGTSYVLLGGDQPVVPSRVAFAFDCEAGLREDENDLYADLYYSDLDGTWDANGNGVFGEVDDEVDLYPDVLVGRAPTGDLAQAEAVVDKFLTYERTPPSGYVKNVLFFAELLWREPLTDSGVGKDLVAARHFGPGYSPILRLYESLGNESRADVRNALNAGPHLVNHGGHASEDVLSCGNGSIGRDEVSALVNGPYYFILYSIGCWAGAFDRDCIGERFVTSPQGGAVAFIGNSRYGWGSPGNPGWGYSETFDSDFYGAILSEGLVQLGAAVAWPKILRIPYARDANVYRWHEYQVNLLGDPEMSCHTEEIRDLSLEAPAGLPVGAIEFAATVKDDVGPVGGARLCLAGPDVYLTGLSDAAGRVRFSPAIPGPETLVLTATAPNHRYVQQTLTAAGDDPFLALESSVIDDDAVAPSWGNGDGEIGAGERVELWTSVRNHGGTSSRGVTGTLSTHSEQVFVREAEATYGIAAPGGTAAAAAPFVLDVAPDCPDDEVLGFNLRLEDDQHRSWTVPLSLSVVRPCAAFRSYSAVELSGDGDGVIDPGETIELTVRCRNEGSGNLGPTAATLSTDDPDLAIDQAIGTIDASCEPGGIVALRPPFVIRVAPSCPADGYARLSLVLHHAEGVTDHAFLLAIGEPGCEEDMEDGAPGWEHWGTNDLWHLTGDRRHSGETSWYCGDADHRYLDGTEATLLGPAFVAPERARLSFWCYFDVTTYGTDGLFVEILNGSEWETLDYLGSGGALDSTLFECDWAEHRYDLAGLTPGSTTRIRFRLVTDALDAAEGFYIDDVAVRPVPVVDPPDAALPSELELRLLSANPTGSETRWRIDLPEACRVRCGIFDSNGRRVRGLLDNPLPAGEREVRWDGRTERGTRAPAGVYWLRVVAGKEQLSRRLVRVE
jgi:hypothetical protein